MLIKTRGDHDEAYATIRSIFERINDDGFFEGRYFEQQIADFFADEQRTLRIVGIFTLAAILISALGLLAMSTYYMQQKQQETAVRKVFGATRREMLRRLVGNFMAQVASHSSSPYRSHGTPSTAGCRITASASGSARGSSSQPAHSPRPSHWPPSSGRAAEPLPRTPSTHSKTDPLGDTVHQKRITTNQIIPSC